MTMNGINDFKIPQYMDIAHPNRGFFGYLLRCRCLRAEEFYGDFIFLDDGIDCFKKFPTVRKRREEMRVEWNGHINRYQDFFQSQLYYIKEELAQNFYDFMTCGPDDEVRAFLKEFMVGVRASVLHNTLGLEPLYAVSHVSQLSDKDLLYWPHIHVLWGIRKK